MSKAEHLEIEEYDEAGNAVATYINSGGSRVDVVVRAFPTFAVAGNNILMMLSFHNKRRAMLNNYLTSFCLQGTRTV
jgi:hypothetical protein